MYIVPKPQKAEIKNEFLKNRTVKFMEGSLDSRILKAVQKLPLDQGGIPLYITYNETNEEGYRLLVSNEEIRIEGKGINGAFYGIQTLRQIFENETLCCVEIEDNPKNEFRAFYHDITRGRVPKLDTLKSLVDDLAYYKINFLQLYMEHAFPFKEHYGTIDESCCTMPEDIRALDEYCHDNFIDLVPSIATCSHLFDLLNVPENQHLRELIDYKPKYTFWYERMDHHTINVTHPESLSFVKSLIDQYIENFSSEYVHICGDEPFDLTLWSNRREPDCDVHALFIDFFRQILDYVKSKGKKVMIWGSIVPVDKLELKKKFPEGTIMCCAGYLEEPPEERFSKYYKDNFKTIFCPSTSTYFRLIENVNVSRLNIKKLAEYGLKYDADGMMNTNWGDYGNPCSLALSMFGLVAGSQVSWNFENPIDDDFSKAANLLLYKNEKGFEYVAKAGLVHDKAPFWALVRYYSNIIHGSETRVTIFPKGKEIREAAKEAKELYEELSVQRWEKDEFRLELLSSIYGTAVIAELFAKHMGIELERWTNTESWLANYRTLWLQKNKESELFRIEEFFRHLEELPPQNKVFIDYAYEKTASQGEAPEIV